MDCRSEFKSILIQYLNDPCLEGISEKLIGLSAGITPAILYRYRKCTPRHLAELENEALSFAAPAVFEDDPDDAYVSLDHGRVANMQAQATGEFFPFFSRLMEMSLEDCSKALSEAFSSSEPIPNLFEGVIPPQQKWKNGDFVGMTDGDKVRYIGKTFDAVLNEISERDACSRLREQTKVACLCENPNSKRMWNEYGGRGTGFQIAYTKDALFGIGSCGVTVPMIFPVIYEEERPDMSELAMMIALRETGFQFLPGDTPIQRHWFACILKAVYIKSRKLFSHEEEWRIVIPDQSINETNRRFATRLCPISQIRLGEQTSPSDESLLRDIAAKLNVPIMRHDE